MRNLYKYMLTVGKKLKVLKTEDVAVTRDGRVVAIRDKKYNLAHGRYVYKDSLDIVTISVPTLNNLLESKGAVVGSVLAYCYSLEEDTEKYEKKLKDAVALDICLKINGFKDKISMLETLKKDFEDSELTIIKEYE